MADIVLEGRLAADPETRAGEGWQLLTARIAWQEPYWDKQQRKNIYEGTPTEWVQITYQGPGILNLTESLHKGDLVCVVGELRRSHWLAAGEDRYGWECRARTLTPVLKWARAVITRATTPKPAPDPVPQPAPEWSNTLPDTPPF